MIDVFRGELCTATDLPTCIAKLRGLCVRRPLKALAMILVTLRPGGAYLPVRMLNCGRGTKLHGRDDVTTQSGMLATLDRIDENLASKSIRPPMIAEIAVRAANAMHNSSALVEPLFLSGPALQETRGAVASLVSKYASAAIAGENNVVAKSVRHCDNVDLLKEEVFHQLPLSVMRMLDRIEDLRVALRESTGRPLLEGMELQALRYSIGGHYTRHVDEGNYYKSQVDDEHFVYERWQVRRSISFLVYLTYDDWNENDGGSLRMYDGMVEGKVVDVMPLPGSLVVFDSSTVPHEVLPTWRERHAIVGWFLEPNDIEMPRR